MNKTNKFDKQINKELQKAKKLINEKSDTVICEYCGKLLPKNEAGSVYDIEEKKVTFHHDSCFDKYEKHYDRVEGVDKE